MPGSAAPVTYAFLSASTAIPYPPEKNVAGVLSPGATIVEYTNDALPVSEGLIFAANACPKPEGIDPKEVVTGKTPEPVVPVR